MKTKNRDYLDLYHFWLKAFAVAFGMGVVSGLVIAYQFGANWSGFSRSAGGITGPLLAYEVLTAFFLEAGFLGVMLFGMSRVGPGLHFMCTVMVALGTLMSATWILASNSWMQTPQGHKIIDARAVPVDTIEPSNERSRARQTQLVLSRRLDGRAVDGWGRRAGGCSLGVEERDAGGRIHLISSSRRRHLPPE